MPYEKILYEVDGRIATITSNMPDRRNALNRPMLDEFGGALRTAETDTEVRVIITKGAGT